MDDTRLDAISKKMDTLVRKLDAIIRLAVMGMTEGKSQTERIWLFSVAGLQPKEIAEILNTTPNTVRVMLFNLRKSRDRRVRSGPK